MDYTNTAGDTVIARYQASVGNADLADPASGVILLTIPQPFANHNGGQLQFGPDGYLYIGMGDGGSANDPMCNGQRDDTLLGKLLRIDVNQNVNTAPFFGIPPSNPFAAAGPPADGIWAKGLRNPWRFSFDRVTGDLYIADVGQSAREEIDFQPRASAGGENYGWKIMEGTLCGGGGSSGCPGRRASPATLRASRPRSTSTATPAAAAAPARSSADTSIGARRIRRLRASISTATTASGRLFGNGQMLDAQRAAVDDFRRGLVGRALPRHRDREALPVRAPVTPTPTPIPPRMTPVLSLPPRPPPRVVTRPPG